MKEAGAILLIIGLAGFFYFHFEFDASMDFNSGKNTYTKPFNPYDNDYAKLMKDKRNFTYLSAGVTIAGIIILIAGIKKDKKIYRR